MSSSRTHYKELPLSASAIFGLSTATSSRCAARYVPRPLLLPGRRAYPPRSRADQGRGHPHIMKLFDEVLFSLRSAPKIELSTVPEDQHRLRRGLGHRHLVTPADAITSIGKNTPSTPATAPSTARSSTSIFRTPSAVPGSAAPSSSITSCPAASTLSTPEPTARSTAPS